MINSGLRLERRGRIAIIILDRPARKHAFDDEMLSGLETCVAELEDHPARVVALLPTGNVFCGGIDPSPENPLTRSLSQLRGGGNVSACQELAFRFRRVVDRLTSLRGPLLAAICGPALDAGAELALRCDLSIMDPAAVLRLPQAVRGMPPMWGGGAALLRLVPPAVATDLLLAGGELDAARAFSLGLVSRLSQPGRAASQTLELAKSLAAADPAAVRCMVRLLRQGRDDDPAQALELESAMAAQVLAAFGPPAAS